MPGRTTRKILLQGNSCTVSLPKDYRDYYGLKPGVAVTVLYGGVVVIIPKQLEHLIEEKRELIKKLLSGERLHEECGEAKNGGN
ncbi:MAG: hypothetical protein ACTSP1_08195 [Candidatus Freyarchaeota archaeon]